MVDAAKLAIVHIIWADAHTGGHGWISNVLEDMDETLVHTVGFLVPEDHGGKPKHFTIWQSLCEDEGIGLFFIPVDMVRCLNILRLSSSD